MRIWVRDQPKSAFVSAAPPLRSVRRTPHPAPRTPRPATRSPLTDKNNPLAVLAPAVLTR